MKQVQSKSSTPISTFVHDEDENLVSNKSEMTERWIKSPLWLQVGSHKLIQ